MGGGSDGGGTQIIQPPINQATPLQGPLINASMVALSSNDNMNPYGAGYRLTPNVPFGQVAFPGPNQTIYGNPFGANSTPFFGQPSMTQSQINSQMMGGGAAGGQNQGGGGGSAPSQGQNQQQPSQNGQQPPQNPQQSPMNGYQFPILPTQQAQYQHVMAPFQQFFPGIFPQSGTPSPFGAAAQGPNTPPQGGQNGAQAPIAPMTLSPEQLAWLQQMPHAASPQQGGTA